jgi:uncharacterized protein YkwD
MKAKLFFGIVLAALVLAACTPTAPSQPTLLLPTVIVSTNVPTLVPNLVPTNVPTLVPTIVPTFVPTLVPATVSPVTPAASSACADSASFVADITVPDNTNFKQGTTFAKTWRIRNTGTCTWNSNYTLFFSNGNQMGGPASIPFPATAPGATMDLSINLVSPGSDGRYTAKYEFHDASGKPFSIDGGRYIWVTITVGTAVASPTASSAGMGSGTSGTCKYVENATLVSQLLNLVNAARTANGLTALTLNSKLSASAMSHSIDMACHSFLSHKGWDGSTIKSRIAMQGYAYSYADEAIFAQPPEYGGTAQAALDWWLNDPEHRAILLNAQATEIGFGYAYVADSVLGGYFTADVAAP